MPTPNGNTETSSRILDVAEHLVQTRGFNAFSYADIASALHITKAALHYHFPTKARLGASLIERYRVSFLAALDWIDGRCDGAVAKLRAYAGIYGDLLDSDRMCLCGMLAADYATLPKPMQEGVRRFFDANEAWLAGLLLRGRENQEFGFAGTPAEMARFLIGALEGAMLLARSHEDPSRLRLAADLLLAALDPRVPRREEATAWAGT
jgi:TetR/AcrR family transcriptional repressor of nem operon